jgi:hypothetical protein
MSRGSQSKPPSFSFFRASPFISRFRVQNNQDRFPNMILESLELALPVYVIDKECCTEFVVVVRTEYWSRLRRSIKEAIDTLIELTFDVQGAICFVFNTLRFYLDEAEQAIETSSHFVVESIGDKRSSEEDFFSSVKQFLKDVEPIIRTNEYFLIQGTYFQLGPTKFKTKFPIRLREPPVLKSSYYPYIENYIDLKQKTVEAFLARLPTGHENYQGVTEEHKNEKIYCQGSTETVPAVVTANSELCTVEITKSTVSIYIREASCRKIYSYKFGTSAELTGAIEGGEFTKTAFAPSVAMSISEDSSECAMETEFFLHTSDGEEELFRKEYEFKLLLAHIILHHTNAIDLSKMRQLLNYLDVQSNADSSQPCSSFTQDASKENPGNPKIDLNPFDAISASFDLILTSSRLAILQYGVSESLETWLKQSMGFHQYALNCWKCHAGYKAYDDKVILEMEIPETTCGEFIDLALSEYYQNFATVYDGPHPPKKMNEFIVKFVKMYSTDLISSLIDDLGCLKDEEDKAREVLIERIKLIDKVVFGGEHTFHLLKILDVLFDTCGNAFIHCFDIIFGSYYRTEKADWESIQTVIRLISLAKFSLRRLVIIMHPYYFTAKQAFGQDEQVASCYVFGLKITKECSEWLTILCSGGNDGKKIEKFNLLERSNCSMIRQKKFCLLDAADLKWEGYWSKSDKARYDEVNFLKVILHCEKFLKDLMDDTKRMLDRLTVLCDSVGRQGMTNRIKKEIEYLGIQCDLHLLLLIFTIFPKRITFYLGLTFGQFMELLLNENNSTLSSFVSRKQDGAKRMKHDTFAYLSNLVLLHLESRSKRAKIGKPTKETLIFQSLLDRKKPLGRRMLKKFFQLRTKSEGYTAGPMYAYRRYMLLHNPEALTGGVQSCEQSSESKFYTPSNPGIKTRR